MERSQITKFINGSALPKEDRILAIADVFNMTRDEMLPPWVMDQAIGAGQQTSSLRGAQKPPRAPPQGLENFLDRHGHRLEAWVVQMLETMRFKAESRVKTGDEFWWDIVKAIEGNFDKPPKEQEKR